MIDLTRRWNIILTKRLSLRPFSRYDVEDLAPLNGDPEVMRYICPPLSRAKVEEALAWMEREWAERGFGWFHASRLADGRFVGQVGLQHLEYNPANPEIELAYVMAKDLWGAGYAAEAAEAVRDFGIDRLGLAEILAVVDPANVNSVNVLVKLNFTDDGTGFYYGRDCRRFVYRPTDD